MNDKRAYEILRQTMPWVIGAVITKMGQKVNLCPVTFQVISSIYEKPYVVCIGLSNSNYSLETIKKTGEFSYAYPNRNQIKDILYCGTVSGRTVDKLKNAKLKFTDASKIQAPLLLGAVINFECRVTHMHSLDTFTIVTGEILTGAMTNKKVLDKIYALGGVNYGAISKTTILKRGRT